MQAGIEKMDYYYTLFGQVRDKYSPTLPIYLEEMATQVNIIRAALVVLTVHHLAGRRRMQPPF